jgi:hypothetical protein
MPESFQNNNQKRFDFQHIQESHLIEVSNRSNNKKSYSADIRGIFHYMVDHFVKSPVARSSQATVVFS